MLLKHLLLMSVIVLMAMACTKKGALRAPPETVDQVDLARYMGTWYEIARYPNKFQKGCRASTATYTLREDGSVTVVNRCRGKSGIEEAHGTAKVVDPTTNAKLKVTFFWPFYGDYWILDLGKEYDYAVVGSPDRSYLWILSRTPKMEAMLYEQVRSRIEQMGYEPERLIKEQ